jgi:hypothetical protein
VLSRQYREAFFKRLVIDLVMLFTYNIKAAFIYSKEVIMFIFNVQKAFDTVLKKRLLRYITE